MQLVKPEVKSEMVEAIRLKIRGLKHEGIFGIYDAAEAIAEAALSVSPKVNAVPVEELEERIKRIREARGVSKHWKGGAIKELQSFVDKHKGDG